tara:strand:- start:81 stop:647 length:567 start_codon:yes stop_codon:yes gene_type:complete
MDNFIGRYYLDDLSVCDENIEFFKNSKELQKQGFFNSENKDVVYKNIKESIDISENFEFFESQPSTKKLLDFLWISVQDYAKKYDELWETSFEIFHMMKFQYYKPPSGGYKVFHCERNSVSQKTCLVWMFYLNTVEDGGGTEFKYLDHIEKAEKGKLLIWPPDFTHTHRGLVSPSEEKYIFTGWYDFL